MSVFDALRRWGAVGAVVAVSGGLAAWALAWPGLAPWVAAGAASWVLGVGLKIPLMIPLHFWGPRLGPRALGAASGLASGAAELGVVAVGLAWWGLGVGPAQAIAVGLGAGAIENLLLVGSAVRAGEGDDAAETPETSVAGATPPADVPAWLHFAFAIERLGVALPLHVGTRVLVAASVVTGNPAWALAGLLCFTLVDGVPAYGERVGWVWTDPATLGRYYRLTAVVGAVAIGLAWLALPGLAGR